VKTRMFAFVMVTALLLAAAPLNGAYLVYTSKSSVGSATVGGVYETEDFSDSTLNPGISHVASGGAITPPVFSDWVSRGEGFTFLAFPHASERGWGQLGPDALQRGARRADPACITPTEDL
jgi:hypothetical protein